MSALEANTNGLHASSVTLAPPASEPTASESTEVLFEELRVPFCPDLIRWRAHETQRIHGRLHGLLLPYADLRAYMDRLNLLLTPAGWTETYGMATTQSKVFVSCRLSIPRLGCHSSTGEEFAAGENALTAAQAQAFKRACSCFGLGRYLYDFEGVWLEVDRERRPKSTPQIPEWSTPEGWKRGLRPPVRAAKPNRIEQQFPSQTGMQSNADLVESSSHNGKNVVREIQQMESELGKSLYRGLLRDMARVWSPEAIREISLQNAVLAQMRAAQPVVERVRAAASRLGSLTIEKLLRTLNLDSLDKIGDLEVLEKVVLTFEAAADL